MQIGRKDIAWNFAATSMRIASGLILLPLVLRLLPSEEVGLWNIFLTIGTMVTLLDFGFSNSFTRNITYIFSGVKELKAEGYIPVDQNDKSIDYGLLKSVISAMRRYYGILTGIFILCFIVFSPYYLNIILQKYSGNKLQVWIAWFTFGLLVAYQLYTYYYNALLTGRGYVKRSLQIIIIGQSVRILVSVICLLLGLGLLSMVIGFFMSDIVNRTLCYLAFYDKEIKKQLKISKIIPVKKIMKIMTPNALKIGITTVGGFLIMKAVMIIAPLYISLSDIASYGTTKQMIDLITAIGSIWFTTYYPKITLYMVNNEIKGVKRLYIKGKLSLVAAVVVCGIGLVMVGPPLLNFIHSKTHLLSPIMTIVLLIFAYLIENHAMAGGLLLTKNKVPFVKATVISGIATIGLLFFSLKFTTLGIWGMILAPGITQAAYQNWKWPLMVKYELNISIKDYWQTLLNSFKNI